MQNECTTCGKKDNTLQKIDTGHGYTEILCAECRESSVEMGEKLDRVRDLKVVEEALSDFIEAIPHDKDQLPQHELVSEYEWCEDKLLELRKEVQERKQDVRKPVEEIEK